MSRTAASPRPLRSDAERNRRRVLSAALDVVSAQGEDASMEEIATRAGVGVGTLYRRFPTKAELLGALVDDVTAQLTDLARTAHRKASGTGLADFLHAAGELFASRRGCLPRLWNREAISPQMVELRSALSDLLLAAQTAGNIDAAVEMGDLTVLLWALRGVIETTGNVAPDAWKRHLDIHLAGLRTRLGTTHHPPLTMAETDRILLVRR